MSINRATNWLLLLFIAASSDLLVGCGESPIVDINAEPDITAVELSKEFQEDASAAEARYKTGDIVIEGVVLEVKEFPQGSPVAVGGWLALESHKGVSLTCQLEEGQSVADIRVGDTVVVEGSSPEHLGLLGVWVYDCRILNK